MQSRPCSVRTSPSPAAIQSSRSQTRNLLTEDDLRLRLDLFCLERSACGRKQIGHVRAHSEWQASSARVSHDVTISYATALVTMTSAFASWATTQGGVTC